MRVRYLRIANFRGFERLELKPKEHIFLVGQPGAGRSDLVEALWRVLSADSTRFPLTEDLDFYKRDLTRRIEVEVVLGDLGPNLEQMFLDRLELWDLKSDSLLEEIKPTDDSEASAGASLQYVLRLCYRAVWDNDHQHANQWVDFPKFSDPEADEFRRVPRDLRSEIPVALITSTGAALSLGARGDLRELIDKFGQTDFSSSINELTTGVSELAAKLMQSKALEAILDRVLDPLRLTLDLQTRAASDIIRFAPEGGSLSGILRALQPTIKLRENLGFLPLRRHGSTLTGLLQAARALAENDPGGAVVLVDDFGEGIDIEAATHLTATLRVRSGQLWLSTRLGSLGRCFSPEETLRLTVGHDGVRNAHVGRKPKSRPERLAARHVLLQLLPAVSASSVVIVEGPHDRAALSAAAQKQHSEEGTPLLAAHRIALLDAGAADQSGGHTAIPRLAQLARSLGFHVVVVIDWDNDAATAERCLSDNLAHAHVVIRWPRGYAIERAIVGDLSTEAIRSALVELSEALSISLDFDPSGVSGQDLIKRTVKLLKSSGGLHSPFIEALPAGVQPVLLQKCLVAIRAAPNASGHVQL